MSNDQAILHGRPFEKIRVRDSLERRFLRDDVIEVRDAQLEAVKNLVIKVLVQQQAH